MRKIELQMLDALHNGRDWHCENTAVVFSDHNGNPYLSAHVELHGNLIAEVYSTNQIVPGSSDKTLLVAAELSTFREYPTRTTASSLRALGIPCKSGNDPWVDDSIHKLREAE